jgi:hypothetical protein
MEKMILGVILAAVGLAIRYRCRVRLRFIEAGLQPPPQMYQMPDLHAEMREGAELPNETTEVESVEEFAPAPPTIDVPDCSV